MRRREEEAEQAPHIRLLHRLMRPSERCIVVAIRPPEIWPACPACRLSSRAHSSGCESSLRCHHALANSDALSTSTEEAAHTIDEAED